MAFPAAAMPRRGLRGGGIGEIDDHVRGVRREQAEVRGLRSAGAAGQMGSGGADLLGQKLAHAAGDPGDADV